jgi:hypothetical protein
MYIFEENKLSILNKNGLACGTVSETLLQGTEMRAPVSVMVAQLMHCDS